MGSSNLPYTFCVKGKHWYFRHRLWGQGALPGQPGDPEFHAAYGERLKEVAARKNQTKPADDTFPALIAASDMEEAGCTVAEIESVLGHQTFRMALKYASQRLRAKAATAKREGNES